MAQPKTAPLSIRLGDARLAEVDAYATKHGLNRHAAVLELIDVGLRGRAWVAAGRPTPKPIPGSDAAERKQRKAEPIMTVAVRKAGPALDVAFGPAPVAPGSRLKGVKR